MTDDVFQLTEDTFHWPEPQPIGEGGTCGECLYSGYFARDNMDLFLGYVMYRVSP